MFQSMVTELLGDLSWKLVYIDDVLIISLSLQQQIHITGVACERIQRAALRSEFLNCSFAVQEAYVLCPYQD